jgi:hypothetical protein
MNISDRGDRWSVDAEAAQVQRIIFDWAVTLSVAAPHIEAFEIRIEQPFVLSGSNGEEILLNPEGIAANLAPALALLRLSVVRIDAFKDGHLELDFAEGYSLSVAAAEDYEPWEISGVNGVRLVSVPGGNVAVWSGSEN